MCSSISSAALCLPNKLFDQIFSEYLNMDGEKLTDPLRCFRIHSYMSLQRCSNCVRFFRFISIVLLPNDSIHLHRTLHQCGMDREVTVKNHPWQADLPTTNPYIDSSAEQVQVHLAQPQPYDSHSMMAEPAPGKKDSSCCDQCDWVGIKGCCSAMCTFCCTAGVDILRCIDCCFSLCRWKPYQSNIWISYKTSRIDYLNNWIKRWLPRTIFFEAIICRSESWKST